MEAAQLAAENIAYPTGVEQMAEWQMHKRGVYSELITATFADDHEALRQCFAQAGFLANAELRSNLLAWSTKPEHFKASDRIPLIEQLNADSRAGGAAT